MDSLEEQIKKILQKYVPLNTQLIREVEEAIETYRKNTNPWTDNFEEIYDTDEWIKWQNG